VDPPPPLFQPSILMCSSIALAVLRKTLKAVNLLLLIVGVLFLSYSLYLIHNKSYIVSFGASSLLVSGAILFVFTSALAYGGKNYSPFLLTYSFMIFLTLLSQLAFISVYLKKEDRHMDWDRLRAKAPAIVDLVEHRTHLFQKLTLLLMVLEGFAILCATLLSYQLRDQRKMLEYESMDLEEQQDLLNRSRRQENYDNAKRRRKERMRKLREMRERFDGQ
jgi:hypothetical protein